MSFYWERDSRPPEEIDRKYKEFIAVFGIGAFCCYYLALFEIWNYIRNYRMYISGENAEMHTYLLSSTIGSAASFAIIGAIATIIAIHLRIRMRKRDANT
jgi:hypothetical protein